MADWLSRDAPELVARNFRTLREPAGWGLGADGPVDRGVCAAMLPLQYPKVFRAGAALDPEPLTACPEVLPDAVLRAGATAWMWLVRQARTPASGCSWPSSRRTGAARRSSRRRSSGAAPGSRGHVKTIRPAAGHNFQTWSGNYPDALGLLSAELAPPAAGR
ncbi:hypothetical protein [Streptomyces sp. NPDC007205]|uniref:hypothetical protein n=1 Tax=Streptomyces sp. NPDC007205 TaxID=3154316 RepID=UPI0033E87757